MAWAWGRGYLFIWPLTEGGVFKKLDWCTSIWKSLHLIQQYVSASPSCDSAKRASSSVFPTKKAFVSNQFVNLRSASFCWCMRRVIAVLPWQRQYFLSNATTHLYLAYSLTFLHIIMVRSGHTRVKMKFLLFDMWPKLDLVIIYVHFVFKRCFNISSQCQEAEVYFCTSSFHANL